MSTTNTFPVGFVGLGAMGISMATHLVHSSFPVTGYDVNPVTVSALVTSGGTAAVSPANAVSEASVVIFMVATADHVRSALFTPDTGAVYGLMKDATIILHSTIGPTEPEKIRRRLETEYGRGDVVLIDAPVSGGVKRAANGTLSIMVSAERDEDLQRHDVKAILECTAQTVYHIPGGLGGALKAKAVNQVLCGIHIAAAAEIMGLAAVLGMDLRLFARRIAGDGAEKPVPWSWMFEDRVPRMLAVDPPLASAMSIILKDVRIVTSEATRVSVDVPLCKISQTVYERAVELGLERSDDSSVVQAYLCDERDSNRMDLWRERASSKTRLSDEEAERLIAKLSCAHAAIHAKAAYEALTFAIGIGMCRNETQTKQWYEILASAAAASTMFVQGMPRMLQSMTANNFKDGVLELLVPVQEEELVKTLKDVAALASNQGYSPRLILETERFFGAASSGDVTCSGKPVRLLADSSFD